MGENWDAGQPVDLFFLFDASASQDNQIKEMLESARGIVGMFAGEVGNSTGNKTPDELKDQCHVTSALFLGPTIKFMCA